MTTSAGPTELAILGLSHELRAPVGAIALAAAGLRRATGDAERDCLLDALLGETRRLDRILENLLDVSRLQTGEVRARPVACAPEELVAAAVAAAALETDGAAVEVVVERGCPPVLADPFLTERILVNLLHNAVRQRRAAGAAAGRPRRGARRPDRERLGAGHRATPAASLFRTFVDSSGTGGLGVGLRLSHGLAAAQGADLRMLRVPSGACFALSLENVPPRELLRDEG